MTYQEFLQQKIAISENFGFEVSLDEIHPILKPHQKAIVQWAVRGGRRALFESFGSPSRPGRGVERIPIFNDSLFYLRQAEHESSIPTLFDLLDTEEVPL